MKRAVVVGLARLDDLVDEVLYRPAVVKAFSWLPRWYYCDLARLSIVLDDRWRLGHWDEYGPAGVCEACHRRGACISWGGWDENYEGQRTPEDSGFMYDREVHLCGWCLMPAVFPADEQELQAVLRQAGADSVSWRWRRRWL